MTRARDLAAFVSNADGDIKFDTDTLFIDSSANRVGIGTDTPATQIELSSTDPTLRFNDSNGGTDTKNFELRYVGTSSPDIDGLYFRTVNDANSVYTNKVAMLGNGNVGIGTDSPSQSLHIDSGTVSAIQVEGSSRSDLFLVDSGAGTDLKRRTIRSDGGVLQFGMENDAISSYTEHVRIQGTGGISFNGDTAAANALDDYETGNWTPTLPQGGSASNNYSSYVKIGDLVTASTYVSAASVPNDNNQFQIGGLPFTSHSNSNYYAGGSLSYAATLNIGFWSQPLVQNNSTYMYFHRTDSNGSSITNAQVTGATRFFIVQVTYHTQIP